MCALRFIDGFDHYVTADLTEKWTATSGPAINAAYGRRSTAGMRAVTGVNQYLSLTLDAQPTWIVGCAVRWGVFPSAGPIMQWLDGATVQCELWITNTGLLQVVRGGVTLGTSSSGVTVATFAYLEWSVTCSTTVGVSAIRVNGVSVLTLSGVNTAAAGTTTANNFRLGFISFSGAGQNQDHDDLYICDGTGAAPHNTMLGDCRVDTLLPSGDGSNSAWTCSTGTAHAALVDETAPNDDTDYLFTATAAARDTHAMGNLPALGTPMILGVQHCLSARKDDAGTRQVKSVLKSGATTAAGTTTHTLSTTYAYYRQLWLTDPATGVAWTTTALDALEAGVENI